ncbi:unnamed protein product [Ambrosiozyma monospora]|uniref:Unnamed protein product n=1 Tax=Ambrosiozyma monospora TaxID=43982 RepID=A0ACB5SWU4_AMBMO|nr:unnamed protein product [Ambrosiozyma monospora]
MNRIFITQALAIPRRSYSTTNKATKADYYRLKAKLNHQKDPSVRAKEIEEAAAYNPFKASTTTVRPRRRKSPKTTSTDDKKPQSMTFDTRSNYGKNPDFDKVFGYSGNKNKSTKSSRRDVSYRENIRTICGVKVPQRPIEPDTCCMSGCVNCVWELFEDDMQEWKQITKEAVDRLVAQGDNVVEMWPKGFDPPPKELPDKCLLSLKR